MTVALVQSQLETALAQIKQDLIWRVLSRRQFSEALRLQAQQPIPGPGPEAKQAEHSSIRRRSGKHRQATRGTP